MSLTFDLAHALIGFTFAPRLYTRNVRLFVQFYICCIFAPQSEPIFDSATAIEILNGIDFCLNTMDCTWHIFSLLLSRIIPIRTHSRRAPVGE